MAVWKPTSPPAAPAAPTPKPSIVSRLARTRRAVGLRALHPAVWPRVGSGTSSGLDVTGGRVAFDRGLWLSAVRAARQVGTPPVEEEAHGRDDPDARYDRGADEGRDE